MEATTHLSATVAWCGFALGLVFGLVGGTMQTSSSPADPLFWLQLLVILVLTAAACRPWWRSTEAASGPAGMHVVIVLGSGLIGMVALHDRREALRAGRLHEPFNLPGFVLGLAATARLPLVFAAPFFMLTGARRISSTTTKALRMSASD